MIKVCHNSVSAMYDDGDNWVWKKHREDLKDAQIISKTSYPLLPLSAVITYDMETDNEEIIDELRKIDDLRKKIYKVGVSK